MSSLCLTVPELLFVIFDSRDRHGHRILNLRNVALVCKTFLEPALDLLWSIQTDLRPLLKCFPADLWEETSLDPWKFHFTRSIQADDWARFDFYAARINALNIGCTSTPQKRITVKGDIFRAMKLSRDLLQRSSPLLPNLHTLIWPSDQTSLWEIRHFLGDKITRLSITLSSSRNSGPENAAALDMIRSRCQQLEYFAIRASSRSENFKSRLSDTFHSLGRLCEVALFAILTPETFAYLAALPTLQILHCNILDQSNLSSLLSSLPERPFKALQRLRLSSVPTLQVATGLINATTYVSIRAIEVGVLTPPSAPQLRNFFSAVVEHCIPSNMVGIEVSNDITKIPQLMRTVEPEHFLDRETIEPLFQLRNLNKLWIETWISTQKVTDALLRELVVAMPALVSLLLAARLGGRWPSQVTAKGLFGLAKNARLRMLGIVLDMSAFDARTMRRPGEGIMNLALEKFVMGQTLIGNTRAFAAFISDIFPNLNHIVGWTSHNNDDQNEVEKFQTWQEFVDLYSWFVVVRKQEKIWYYEARRDLVTI